MRQLITILINFNSRSTFIFQCAIFRFYSWTYSVLSVRIVLLCFAWLAFSQGEVSFLKVVLAKVVRNPFHIVYDLSIARQFVEFIIINIV